MDENFIYDDLATQGDLGAKINDLQIRNDDLQHLVTSLEGDISKLCNKITEMKRTQEILSKNISELFNTAKNELDRKDRRIADLQSQLDELIFRRKSVPQQPSFKRKCEDTNLDSNNKRLHRDVEKSYIHDRKSITDRKVENDRLISSTELCLQPETNVERIVHSRDDIGSRDRKEHYNDKRDTFRDSRMDHKNSRMDHRDSRIDHRDSRMDHRDSRMDHKDSRMDNRFSRDKRDFRRNYKDDHRENRDNRVSRDRNLNLRNRSIDGRPINRERNKDIPREHSHNRRDEREINIENRERQHYRYKDELEEYKNRIPNDLKFDDDNQMKFHSEVEAVFSEESSGETDTEKNLDSSKEEGELSDDELQTQFEQEEKASLKKKERNVPVDIGKTFNVHKFIEKQDELKKLKNKIIDDSKPETKTDSVNLKNSKAKQENINEEIHNKSGYRKRTSIKASNNEFCSEEGKKSKKDEDSDNVKCDTNVNILSQVILHEGPEPPPILTSSEPQQEGKNTSQSLIQKNEDKVSKTVKKIDKKKRESGVPRDLTNELNIQLESRKLHEQKMKCLDSSEKKSSTSDQLSIYNNFDLSHDGDIPKLKFCSNSKTADTKSNSGSFGASRQTNPVTEFQIFKSNLPCLEKSNSLSSISVQIQSPTSNSKKGAEEVSHIRNNESLVEETKKLSSKIPNKCQDHNTKEIIEVENEKPSTNDVCNMSMDYLNMDLGQYKAEDFPNLVAHSDISDLLKTPVQEKIVTNSQKLANIVGTSNNTESAISNTNNLLTSENPVIDNENLSKSNNGKPVKAVVKEENRNISKMRKTTKEGALPKEPVKGNFDPPIIDLCSDTQDKAKTVPYSIPRSQPRNISDILVTPLKENIQTDPMKLTHSIPTKEDKYSTQPGKSRSNKSNLPKTTQTLPGATKNKELKQMHQSVEKSQYPPLDKKEQISNMEEIIKKTTTSTIIDGQINMVGNKDEQFSKPTDGSDMIDLVSTSKEKCEKNILKKCTNLSKTSINKNVTESTQKSINVNTENLSEISKEEKNNEPDSSKLRRKLSRKVKKTPPEKEIKSRSSPKVQLHEVSKTKEVSEELKFQQCQVSTRSNSEKGESTHELSNVDMKQNKTENLPVSITNSQSIDISESREDLNVLPEDVMKENEIENSKSTKKSNSSDVTDSLPKTAIGKEVDSVNKQTIKNQMTPRKSQNTGTKTPFKKRQKCVMKWIK